MRTILQGWNVMRIVRLVLGVAILVQGTIAKDTLQIVLGLALGGLAVANIGCCGVGGCTVNTRSTSPQTEEIVYEEVVSKK